LSRSFVCCWTLRWLADRIEELDAESASDDE